jgi:hypothetical protein
VNETPNAESPQTPAAEAVAQEPDLDSLLAEYDQPQVDEPQTPTPQVAPTTDEVAEMRQMLSESRADKLDAGLTESAQMVKTAAGDSAANIPEWVFKGALREEAVRNPTIERIFNDRAANPTAWNRVASALGKKIAQDMTPTDRASTDSWNAVDAAVHSSSTTTPTTKPEVTSKDLRKMSNAEFAAHKKAMGFSR